MRGSGVGGLKVAIVGAGRMGSLLANRIPANCRKVIISRKRASAVTLADEVGGLASDQLSAVRGCDLVFLAVPASEITSVVAGAAPHLEPGAVVVNMAADQPTDELIAAFPDVRFAAAKVIGHIRELALGSPGLVILDHAETEAAERIQTLLEGLGPVVQDDETRAMSAFEAMTTALQEAERRMRADLRGVGLEETWIPVAIVASAPGIIRSLAEGEVADLFGDPITANNPRPLFD